MTDVAVLGLGNMGAALARAFLAHGREVTVWNRTISKAQPLAALGAEVEADAAAAIGAAPVSVVCVERYHQVTALLEDADSAGALAGSTIVNVTWGTPDEARAMSAWVQERGADYLDGDIFNYPDQIGVDMPVLLYSGPSEVYDRVRHVLDDLGAGQRHGTDPALPNVLGAAVATYHHVAVAGFFEAAAYADRFGIAPDRFLELCGTFANPLNERALVRAVSEIASGAFSSDQATLHAHHNAACVNRDQMRRLDQPAAMLSAFVEILEPVLEDKGDLELAAFYEAMR